MPISDMLNQIYGGEGPSAIRQRYEESLAAPSQLNIAAPEIQTGEITELLDKIIQRYKPGGEFGKAELALLERARTKSLATTAQGMVSAGLAGTTAGVGAGRKWEEEVGMPSRLRLEDIRTERLTQAMGAKAGFMERTGTAQTQFELAKAQLELQERLANKQISLQEYLAEMDRLSRRSISGTVQPSAPTTGGEAGGYGADFGGPGPGYVNVGTPGYPSWVQSSMMQAVIGERPMAEEGDILFPAGGGEPRPERMQSLAEMAQKWVAGTPTTFSGY